MYAMTEQWQKSIADYDKGLRFDPKDAYSYNNRGIAKAALGDRNGAIADFKKALALDPSLTQIKDRLKEMGVKQ